MRQDWDKIVSATQVLLDPLVRGASALDELADREGEGQPGRRLRPLRCRRHLVRLVTPVGAKFSEKHSNTVSQSETGYTLHIWTIWISTFHVNPTNNYSTTNDPLKIKFLERNFLHEAKSVNFKPHAQNCSGSNWIHLTAFLLVQKKVWKSKKRISTILPKNSLDEGNFDQKLDTRLKKAWYE